MEGTQTTINIPSQFGDDTISLYTESSNADLHESKAIELDEINIDGVEVEVRNVNIN